MITSLVLNYAIFIIALITQVEFNIEFYFILFSSFLFPRSQSLCSEVRFNPSAAKDNVSSTKELTAAEQRVVSAMVNRISQVFKMLHLLT